MADTPGFGGDDNRHEGRDQDKTVSENTVTRTRRRPLQSLRRCPPLFGSAAHEPLSEQEAAFARSIAHELNYAAVVVATEPNACYPERSAGALVKRFLERQGPAAGVRVRERAEELLALPASERQAYFGDNALHRIRGRVRQPIMTRARRAQLRQIVRKRVEAYRTELQATYEYAATGALPIYPVCPATLEGVLSTEANEYYTDLTISVPSTLDFRWNTPCEEAEVGVWEIRRLPSRTLVASGVVALNSTFSINFGQFLAAQPPPPPQNQVYEVRIRPHRAGTIEEIPGASPGSSKVVKGPPVPAGSYSNPVFVIYAEDTSEDQKLLDTRVYRRLTLHIDHIELVEQQSGEGADEYWLNAVLVEKAGDESPQQKHLLNRKFTFNKPGTKQIDFSRSIHLEYPSSSRWPKEQVLIMTVMEEDGGQDVAETMAEIWNWVSDSFLGDAFDEIREFLDEIGVDPIVAGGISAGLIAVAATLAGSLVAGISAGVLSALAGILAIVGEAVADDYFGTKLVWFTLPTSDEDFVHHTLDGTAQQGGSYQVAPQFVEFREWVLPGTRFYDGFVEVKVHWELENLELIG